jgi:hypothetical protein
MRALAIEPERFRPASAQAFAKIAALLEGGQGNDTLTGGTGYDTFVFNTFDYNQGTGTGTDRIMDYDVDRDSIRFDVGEGDNSSVSISYGNYNPYTFTADVIVRLGDTGTVILEDISLADIGSVAGTIEIV